MDEPVGFGTRADACKWVRDNTDNKLFREYDDNIVIRVDARGHVYVLRQGSTTGRWLWAVAYDEG